MGSQFSLTERPHPAGSEAVMRSDGLPSSYTIAPKSTFDGTRGSEHRPLGAGGMEAFRKMTQKKKKA